jgi:hypothetical protein
LEGVDSARWKCSFATSDTARQETVSHLELVQNVRNVDRSIQHAVELSNNSNVTSANDEIPISASQLHSMFAAFMAAMQAEYAKLASNFESKLNKLPGNLDPKLASVFESWDAKLNCV